MPAKRYEVQYLDLVIQYSNDNSSIRQNKIETRIIYYHLTSSVKEVSSKYFIKYYLSMTLRRDILINDE